MRIFRFLLATCLVLAAASCGRLDSATKTDSVLSDHSSSTFLVESGENARRFYFETLAKNGLSVLDARDPRLYPNGGPFQPPTPADKAIVRIDSHGHIRILALVIDRPGFFKVKEFPTGNYVVSIAFNVESLRYASRFDGLYASVSRNTSGYGWNYVRYLRGYGNSVNGGAFDLAVANFLRNSIRYVASR